MESHDIENYLAELGTELSNRGIKKPVRMMLIGGAYMLLVANAPRTTGLMRSKKGCRRVTKSLFFALDEIE